MKRALLSLSLLLLSSPVWAAICSEPTPGMGKTEIRAISQTIPRDVPVDMVIYTQDILKPDVRVVCSGWSNYNMSAELLRAGAATPAGSNVYPTGIPGIGMRLLWHHPSHIPNPPAGGFYLGSFTTRSLGWGLKEFVVPHAFRLELIKTGPLSSGVSKDLEAVIYYSNAKVHSVHLRQLQYTVVNSGCKVTSSQLHQVDLLDVKASTFTHRGAFAGAKAFHIDLLCDKGVKVAYQIDGLNSANHTLLNNMMGAGAAQGVGIQLLQGDNSSDIVQLLGVRTDFRPHPTTVDNEALSIPLVARYLQIADKIQAGNIAASATVTLFYE